MPLSIAVISVFKKCALHRMVRVIITKIYTLRITQFSRNENKKQAL